MVWIRPVMRRALRGRPGPAGRGPKLTCALALLVLLAACGVKGPPRPPPADPPPAAADGGVPRAAEPAAGDVPQRPDAGTLDAAVEGS
jgi:predicted small lipoprotein YifL